MNFRLIVTVVVVLLSAFDDAAAQQATRGFAAITVSDLAQSEGWYQTHLGTRRLTASRAPSGVAQNVVIGNEYFVFELIHFAAKAPSDTVIKDVRAIGLQKVGIWVAPEVFDSVFRHLTALNATFLGGIMTDHALGARTFIVRDNGGVLLQYFAPLSATRSDAVSSTTGAPIERYVPQFPRGAGGPITLRFLQAHLGGVRGYRPNERDPNFFRRHYARASEAIEIFANDSLVPPGSQPIYSSYGYNLIAAALERATGKSFPGLLASEVIAPLGLRRTMTPDARVPIHNRSRSYTYYSPNHPTVATDTLFRGRDHDYSYNYGGGNLLTTAEDLVQFARVVLKPGFLQPATLNMLMTPFRPNAIQNFGWVITHDDAQRPVLFGTGEIEAFQAGITVWPQHDLIVAITSNTQGKGSGNAELRRDVPRRVGLYLLHQNPR